MNWKNIPGKYPEARYEIDVSWRYLEEWLKEMDESGINLDPEYQRAHVWTKDQQRAYVEYALRGGEGGLVLYWNSAGWGSECEVGVLELVDGKQRMQAVRQFMAGELGVFDDNRLENPRKLNYGDHRFRMRVCGLKTRSEVLQWYLAINAGGTPHSEDELDRVRNLLSVEKTK